MAPVLPNHSHKKKEDSQQLLVDVAAGKIEVIRVTDYLDVKPKSLDSLRLHELQSDCDRWGIVVSGNRTEVLERLRRLYRGEPVLRKGCTRSSTSSSCRMKDPKLGSRPRQRQLLGAACPLER